MKTTWEEISRMVSAESGIPAATVEMVLKGFKRVTDQESDPDCELMNAFHGLPEGEA